MIRTITTEFLKLKRSPLLWLMLLAGIFPPLIHAAQYATTTPAAADGWMFLLAENQELFAFCTLTAVLLAAIMIFSMEYQYGTASYIFTSATSRVKIYIGKLAALLLMICLMFAVSTAAQLLIGFAMLGSSIPPMLMTELLFCTVWYICAYFLLAVLAAMVVALTKRFVISAGILFGYLILSFPVHYFGYNPYVSPFLTPAVVASKIYDTGGYLFGNYYRGVAINIVDLTGFLVMLAIAAFAVGIVYYKKSDAIL